MFYGGGGGVGMTCDEFSKACPNLCTSTHHSFPTTGQTAEYVACQICTLVSHHRSLG